MKAEEGLIFHVGSCCEGEMQEVATGWNGNASSSLRSLSTWITWAVILGYNELQGLAMGRVEEVRGCPETRRQCLWVV